MGLRNLERRAVWLLAGLAAAAGFARAPTRMVLSASPKAAAAPKAAPAAPKAAWAVSAASVQRDAMLSLDAALEDAARQLEGRRANVAVLRLSLPEADAASAALAEEAAARTSARLGLRPGQLVGLVAPMRDADEDLARVSVTSLPSELFHVSAGDLPHLHADLFATAGDSGMLLYPCEDFIETDMHQFLDRVHAEGALVDPIGEPAWQGDLLFTTDAGAAEVRIVEGGMLGLKLANVSELEKKWPWWQRSLVPMLRWMDR